MVVPLVKMDGISKSFPGVHALQGVDLELFAGEVVAVLGENGAGKSTLMKILGGAIRSDQGKISIEGREADVSTPQLSKQAGIAVIYQEFNLIPALNSIENVFLGKEKGLSGWIQRKQERHEATEIFKKLGADFDLLLPCRLLTIAQQQLVEIAKALCGKAKILVMDEPSAALTNHEVARLFRIIRELKEQSLGVLYITHRLEEVSTISDRVVILRDGKNVANRSTADIQRHEIIEAMVGRELKNEYPPRQYVAGEVLFEIKRLNRKPLVNEVSLSVRSGEILGIAGLIGSGRTELARVIFGADLPDSGDIFLEGKQLRNRSPREAIHAGIGLLTEDRKHQGLVLKHSVRDNFALPNLERLSKNGFLDLAQEEKEFNNFVHTLNIKISGPDQQAAFLSVGNQQKIVLAKWLARDCKVLIFDEPTRGIDAGAKYEIYLLMMELARQGKAIIMISSELPELIGMADRILVMHDGRITGEIAEPKKTTQETIMQLAIN